MYGGNSEKKYASAIFPRGIHTVHEVSRQNLDAPYIPMIRTYRQAETNMSPLFQSWGHKKCRNNSGQES